MNDRMENKADELAGRAKEGIGKVTGDRGTEAEGQGQQLKAKTKDALDATRDRVEGFVDGMTGKKDE
ncbi:CsbD family protein [Fodinicola acaciae]|uniref:CsbD family protein n=1 Tax=Fodinicola acaciae TaxID=2681555 RepID=UPI0013D143B2|nr:CsbD family protein [Fodinicola acaciae]